MMHSLTFDQDEMYIFVFSVDDQFVVKENLENFVCNKCIYVPSIFCENFINVHANFFKLKSFKYLLLFRSLTTVVTKRNEMQEIKSVFVYVYVLKNRIVNINRNKKKTEFISPT